MREYTLGSSGGIRVRVMDYGGVVRTLEVPDRDGRLADVVLGFDAPEEYRENPPYFGALVGRYANRIARGCFELDGERYRLTQNHGEHHLHGGVIGLDAVAWEAERVSSAGGDGLLLRHTSPDGHEGYPGTLELRVRYTVTADRLIVDYEATTDRPTPLNLTQHSYFNLAGHGAGTVLDHELSLHADAFLPTDDESIPTGEVRPVAGTPFDLRRPVPIGRRIEADDEQLRFGQGYDHCFVLRPEAPADAAERGGAGTRDPGAPGAAPRPTPAARVYEPVSGRVLEVFTTEPGVQLYTGNHLDGLPGKDGAEYGPRTGVALETQHFPDSPNHPGFPSTVLRPGQTFRSRTIFAFSVRPA